jgi:hypothetical protein
VVPPALVTVELARTPKVLADPRATGAWPAVASWRGNITPTARTMIHPNAFNLFFLFIITDVLVILFLSSFLLFTDIFSVMFLGF